MARSSWAGADSRRGQQTLWGRVYTEPRWGCGGRGQSQQTAHKLPCYTILCKRDEGKAAAVSAARSEASESAAVLLAWRPGCGSKEEQASPTSQRARQGACHSQPKPARAPVLLRADDARRAAGGGAALHSAPRRYAANDSCQPTTSAGPGGSAAQPIVSRVLATGAGDG
ncbi:hypothetical protein OPT61_g10485 [Boeremia exigua]|uniref:Uncharacterized protein n=1 Tax=Boeremia exigua TaxID=749465 RepID=A0ACC2HQ26_9PLEO|nr:hypothetical protein OPT61_g10485 [Boeremia exigua]